MQHATLLSRYNASAKPMKTIGIIGSHLIHTFAYAMHFNHPDLEKAASATSIPMWQLELLKSAGEFNPLGGARLTHIFGEPEGVAKDMAAIFDLQRADSAQQVLDACDSVMVMDENPDSRAKMIHLAIDSGVDVFADKLVSIEPRATAQTLELARKRSVRLAAWSQMGFAEELTRLHGLPTGGTAYITFGVDPDEFEAYGIHVISAVQGAFPGRIMELQRLKAGPQRLALLEHEVGTSILLGIGGRFPAGFVRIDYSVEGKTTSIETANKALAFRNAAREILALLDGKPPRFGPADMIEASRLVALLCKPRVDQVPLRLL